jgi:hypothetical protein
MLRGRTSLGMYPRFWFGEDEKDLCRNAQRHEAWMVRPATQQKDPMRPKIGAYWWPWANLPHFE